MKKLSYLIVLALISSLVLAGCSLLSNIGQAPVTEQSGISYLTKGVGMTVVSGDSVATVITKVYNKALGLNTVVDLSSSPLPAVRAWEPDPYPTTYPVEPPEATDSTWDNGVNWFENNGSSADWIWETHLANGPADYALANPLYDVNAAKWGRVVLFETTFVILGNPTSATLRIAADNGYEVWVNNGAHHRSPTVSGPGWENTSLHQTDLNTGGWQSYGTFTIGGSELFNGSNTLHVLAGNEYFASDDGNSQIPASMYNPGAVIFHLDIDYEVVIEEVPGIAIEKSGPATAHIGDTITYTYTVTNAGDVPLSAVTVSDDLAGTAVYVSGDTNTDGFLDLVETWIFTANYEVPSGVDPVVNIATAYGTSPQATQVTDDDDWSVDILNPEILVEKSANTEVAAPGDMVTYSYTVTNTGDCILYDVSLVDDVVGPIILTGLTDEDSDGFSDDLAVDATATGTADYLVTINDPEWLENTATAEGTDELDLTVDDEDSLKIHTMCARTIGYWKNHLEDWCTLPSESIFDGVGQPTLLTYLPGSGAEVNGMNPLEMLRAQLLAAELNVACFDVEFDYSRYDAANIYDTILDAEEFLDSLGTDDLNTYWSNLGKAGQRAFRIANADSLALKDVLDTFNNMGDECF